MDQTSVLEACDRELARIGWRPWFTWGDDIIALWEKVWKAKEAHHPLTRRAIDRLVAEADLAQAHYDDYKGHHLRWVAYLLRTL